MAEKGLKILIIGGHGFIGQKLSAALRGKGYQVFARSRRDGLDLLDLKSTEQALKDTGADFIFNCAAHTGSVHYVTAKAAEVARDNLQMSTNLYAATKEICPGATIVNPLSNCSYPGSSDVQKEEQWWDGPVHESVFSYGNAKRFLYVLAKCYFKQYGLKSVNLLVPNTFGPGDSADPNKTHALNGMIIRMIQALKNADPEFEIWGTGSPVREWAYITDVITVLVESLNFKGGLIEPINIAQNKGYTIKQSAEFIAEALNFKGKLVFNPKYPDGAPVKIMDDRRFRQMFPDFTFYDHKQGIKETVNYYQSVL